MKCPHCRVEIHEDFQIEFLRGRAGLGEDNGHVATWHTLSMACPACKRAIIKLGRQSGHSGGHATWLVFPIAPERMPASTEVPEELRIDYDEAGRVLPHSSKASAALSRRCLQTLLRAQGYTQKDLAPAIQAVLDARQLPSWLAENLDAIRNVGNFAAHPMKDSNTGAIVEVEPHEAEWNLEVLEGLFDFYYVQPAKDAARRAAFNAKLQAAGKPAMK